MAHSKIAYTSKFADEDIVIQFTTEQQVLRRSRHEIINLIVPNFLCLHLSDCLSDYDEQNIRKKTENHGNIEGSMELLDRVIRKPLFWDKLLNAFRNCEPDHMHVAEILENNMVKYRDEHSKLEEVSNVSSSQVNKDENYQMLSEEQAQVQTPLRPLSDKITTTRVEQVQLTDIKEPRRYQLELAKPAKQGQNTIICAPTNSGKTYIASLICSAHLDERLQNTNESSACKAMKKPKIIVVAPRFVILIQHFRTFTQDFPLLNVGKRSGASKEKIPLNDSLEKDDILIVTADILKNALEDKSLEITKPTLLIFDECHHTMQDHPYNKIMGEYLKVKIKHPGSNLPQVIGLSATPGAGKKLSEKDVEDRILTLSANLDADCFVTVPEDLQEELNKFVPQPSKKIMVVEKRKSNPFSTLVNETMVKIEKKAGLTHINLDRAAQEYSSRVQLLLEEARGEDNEEKRKCGEYLLKYNKALEIVNVARLIDGCKYLKEQHAALDNRQTKGELDATEIFTLEIYQSISKDLKVYAGREEEFSNPKLIQLKRGICEFMEECKERKEELRGIVFVETRSLAIAMCQWMKEDDELSKFKPLIYVSANTASEGQHITSTEQRENLDAFNQGNCQILISTSILDEGIHSADCNTTINYDRKTNEIAMRQSMGRTRKMHSVELVIGDVDVVEKNYINLLLIEKMEKAIKNVQIMQKDRKEEYSNKIAKKQQDILKKREKEAEDAKHRQCSNPSNNITLRCKGSCKTILCNASDIQKLGTSHILPNPEFKEMIDFREHTKQISREAGIEKIYCKKCGEDWGNTAKGYPCLKLKSFTILQSGKVIPVKQWSKIPCTILDYDE